MILTDSEVQTIVNALHTAADIYANDARKCQKIVDDGNIAEATGVRMAAQFSQQSRDARELAERLERSC